MLGRSFVGQSLTLTSSRPGLACAALVFGIQSDAARKQTWSCGTAIYLLG
jgi:hypothetical protein